MTTSPHFWLRLLISFLGLWGCGFAANIAWKRKREKGLTSLTVTRMERLRALARITALNTGKIGLGVVLGTLLGMWIRDRQLNDNRWTWTEIEVQKKLAARDYLIRPARMDQQHIQICESSTVDWYEGERLDYWTFEQRQDCKRVITYHETRKGEINASLQMR